MSTLSSASTDAEVWAAYDDAASYEEDADTSKAAAFITACRILLRRRPKRSRQGGIGGSEYEFDPATITAEMERAREWLAANTTPSSSTFSGAVRYADFGYFRY